MVGALGELPKDQVTTENIDSTYLFPLCIDFDGKVDKIGMVFAVARDARRFQGGDRRFSRGRKIRLIERSLGHPWSFPLQVAQSAPVGPRFLAITQFKIMGTGVQTLDIPAHARIGHEPVVAHQLAVDPQCAVAGCGQLENIETRFGDMHSTCVANGVL